LIQRLKGISKYFLSYILCIAVVLQQTKRGIEHHIPILPYQLPAGCRMIVLELKD
jgi:hypothetical protein